MIPIYLITGDINFDHLGFVLRVCVCVCVCVFPEPVHTTWKFSCQSVVEGIPVLLEREAKP